MKSNKLFFGIGLALIGVAAVMYFSSPSSTKTGHSGPKNDRISFSTRSINQGDFSLDYHRGKPVVVNFWATWCPPCVKEIPHFVEAQEKYKDKVQFVGISLDDSPQPVGPFISKHRINYPIVMSSRAISNQFGSITSIPTTFILDKDHKIIDVAVGYRDLNYLTNILDPLVN
jgi:thiol-disulfide isomerase/thioredoxin